MVITGELTDRLGLDTRVTILGHTQRGGAACAYDRWLSTLQFRARDLVQLAILGSLGDNNDRTALSAFGSVLSNPKKHQYWCGLDVPS
jgi:hypothetical protein